MFRIEKNLAGKASGLLEKFVDDDEMLEVLPIMDNIVGRLRGVEVAKKVHVALVKTAAKVFVLHEHKKVTEEDFHSTYLNFRRLSAFLRNTYWSQSHANASAEAACSGEQNMASDTPTEVQPLTLTQDQVDRILKLGDDMHKQLKSVLSTHLSKESIQRLDYAFSVLMDTDLIAKAFADPEFPQIVKNMALFLANNK